MATSETVKREMMVIDTNRNDKVILLPKTVDYYQEELTRMLENERFGDAVRLLEFLLDCRSDDPQTAQEWQTLLEWLHNSFGAQLESEADEEEVTEGDLHKQRFYTKMAEDPGYVKKLLETVLTHPDLEKKMLAIEQLAVAEHPQIDETLKRWLEQVDLHPLVQYKVLQTLRARGATGSIDVTKNGEQLTLKISDTPLDMIHYAEPIQQVLERVRKACEADHPSLVYFADHTWKEFLAYIYGTSVYDAMKRMKSSDIEVWAAALHQAVIESMIGSEQGEDVFQLYKLKAESEAQFNQYHERLYAFIRHSFMP